MNRQREIVLESVRVFLGFGSNIGDGIANIQNAACEIENRTGSAVRLSGFWRSKARYYLEQPDFINAVGEIRCCLGAEELLALCNAVEAEMGRDRSLVAEKGPRVIDIDILLYGKEIIASDRLIVPHPGIRERKFVLLPLMQLDSTLQDPVTGTLFQDILSHIPRQGIYPILSQRYDAPYPA